MDKIPPLLAVFCIAAGVSFSALGGEFVTKTYPAGACFGFGSYTGYRADDPKAAILEVTYEE